MCAQATSAAGVDYLACADGASGEPAAKAAACAKEGSLPWDKISACFGGDQGAGLVKAAADYFEGRFPAPVGVPRIEVNGKEVASRSYGAVLHALCETGIKAPACAADARPTAAVVV